MAHPKTQGGNYERDIARQLSLWLTEGKNPDVFYRSHASGGRATNRKKAGRELKGQYGDICAMEAIGKPLIDKWTIECKHGYGKKTNIKALRGKQIQIQWCILDILDSMQNIPVFTELWLLACKEARDSGNTIPILIMQRARRASIIAMPLREYYKWESIYGNAKAPIYITVKENRVSTIVIMNLEAFFTWTAKYPIRRFNRNIYNA